jgi:hypothetical protein
MDTVLIKSVVHLLGQIVFCLMVFYLHLQDVGNRVTLMTMLQCCNVAMLSPYIFMLYWEFLGNDLEPNTGLKFGTPIWDPDLGPRYRTPIWNPNLGPRFGTPIWDPDLGPRFEALWDPDLGPRFGTPI